MAAEVDMCIIMTETERLSINISDTKDPLTGVKPAKVNPFSFSKERDSAMRCMMGMA